MNKGVGIKMLSIRERRGISREEIHVKCCCSVALLRLIEEEGAITHPLIAAWIAAAYGLDVDDYNKLVAECHAAKRLPRPKKIHAEWHGYNDLGRKMLDKTTDSGSEAFLDSSRF